MAPLQARQKRLNRASGDNARRLRTVLDNRPAGTSDQESILEQTGCSTFVDCPDLELRPAGRRRGSGAAILVSSGIPLPDRLVGYPNAVVVGELRTGALVRSPGVLRPWCRPRPRCTQINQATTACIHNHSCSALARCGSGRAGGARIVRDAGETDEGLRVKDYGLTYVEVR